MTERPPEVVLDDLAAPVFAPHIQEVFDSVGPMAADLGFVPDELKALAVEAEGARRLRRRPLRGGPGRALPGPDRRRRAERHGGDLPAHPAGPAPAQPAAGPAGADPPPRDPGPRDRGPDHRGRPAPDRDHPPPQPHVGRPRPALAAVLGVAGTGAARTTSGVPTPTPGASAATWPSGFMDEAMPYFKRMHEMTTDHVHEEIQLLAMDFSTMLFESVVPLPTYRDWWKATDQTASYRYLKDVLRVLTHERGGDRWVLKSPQHLSCFPRPGRGVPGRHLRRHPPGPRGGHPVDGHDGRLLLPDEPGPPRPDGAGGLLAGPGAGPAGRLRPGPRGAARTPRPSTSASTSSWPTTWPWSSASTPSPTSPGTTGPGPRSTPTWPTHPRGRHGGVRYDFAVLGLDRPDLEQPSPSTPAR